MLVWLSVWSKVQTCIWPSWCHCHSLSLASVKLKFFIFFGIEESGQQVQLHLYWAANNPLDLCNGLQEPENWSLRDYHTHTHTHTRLTALFPGLPRWAGNRKVKPTWILLKQETVSGSGISWAICKFAPRSRQITTPAPHHAVFYRPDALPDQISQKQYRIRV